MVVNATLAAIAKHGVAQKPEINVYQIASSVVNPLVFHDLAKLLYKHYNSSPCMDSKDGPRKVPSMELFRSYPWKNSPLTYETRNYLQKIRITSEVPS